VVTAREEIRLPPMLLADGRVLTWTGVITAPQPPPDPDPDPTPDPDPVPPPSTRRSGLPWDSGVFANDGSMPARFAAMRGRPVDLADVHCEAEDVANPYWLRDYTPSTVGGLMLSCPLTPAQSPAEFEKAGRAMAQRGFKGSRARLRPGVEMNLPNQSRISDSTADAWIGRFRAAADAFRAGAGSGAVVCLCVNEGRSQVPISDANLRRVCETLLRDGSAAELGVDLYDQWPPMLTAQAFADRVAPGRFGSLGYWADLASSCGRRVSVPEWGVARTDGGQWAGHAGGDNPTFIEGMIGWFRANVHRLGCESYFAEPDDYIRSDLTTQMPRSRAAYVAALR
jgi:hypothetical protein